MESKRIKQPWGYEWRTEDDKLHRINGPAVEYNDGTKYWYVDGKYLTEGEFNKHPLVIKYMNRQKIRKWINGE